MYRAIRSLAEIIISIPTVARSTRTGYSKQAMRSTFMKWCDSTSVDGRSEDRQHLHGAGEVVDDVSAAETAEFARRAGHDEHAGNRQSKQSQHVDEFDADPAHEDAEHEQAHGGECENDFGTAGTASASFRMSASSGIIVPSTG